MANLFPNPSFETDLSNWGNDASYTRSNDTAEDGSWSVKQVATSGYDNFTTQNDAPHKIPVSVGTKYTLSLWYKLTINSGLSPNYEIHDDLPYSGSNLATGNLTAASVWTQKVINFTSDSTGYVTLRIYNNNGNVLAYYDNFNLDLTPGGGTGSLLSQRLPF